MLFQKNCLVKGERKHEKFTDEKLEEKVMKCFDPIPKMEVKSCNSLTQRCQSTPDIQKVTIKLTENIDIVQIRDHILKKLIQ